MREILGDRAYRTAKKQTMRKLSTLREVILDASRHTARPHCTSRNLKIEKGDMMYQVIEKKKVYTFELVIWEGSDEFWESIEDGKSGADEVREAIASLLAQGGWFHGQGMALKLSKFDREFWKKQDFPMIDWCDELCILVIPGYEELV